MSIAADIQKQLEELWESAEQVAPQEGDTYVGKAWGHTNYSIGVAGWPLSPERYRVLERAKPKAPEREAVVASYVEDAKHVREMFVWDECDERWISKSWWLKADELVDPVPLVEMPEREALMAALLGASPSMGPIETGGLADAVLELLRGER